MSYKISTKMSWSQTMMELSQEFKTWKIEDWAVNEPRGAKLQGYKSQDLQDRTVILTYYKNNKPVNLEMSSQDRAVDNLRVIFLAIQAIRLNEKRGIGEVLASAYKQLSSPTAETIDFDPYKEMGILPDAPMEVITATFNALAKLRHPDQGGTTEKMSRLNQAYSFIKKQRE